MDTVYVVTNDGGVMSSLVPVGSMLIALAAVVVGPILAMRTARRQTILPLREQRNMRLHDSLADFLTTSYTIHAKVIAKSQFAYDELEEAVKTLIGSKHRIQLMLDPTDDLHNELVLALDRCIGTGVDIREGEFIQEYWLAISDLAKLSRRVSKAEWSKIRDWTH